MSNNVATAAAPLNEIFQGIREGEIVCDSERDSEREREGEDDLRHRGRD